MKISGNIIAGLIIIVSFVYAVNIQPVVTGDTNSDFWRNNPNVNIIGTGSFDSHTYNLVSFSSYKALTDFLNNCSGSEYRNWGYYEDINAGFAPKTMISAVPETGNGGTVIDYSQTNIQIAGVDEPDTVKTDGKYIYLLKDSIVFIILAYPSDEAKIVSKIQVDYSIENILINGDRLVVFGNQYSYFVSDDVTSDQIPWYSSSNTFIKIYDLTDREQPVLKRDIVIAGNYFNARMIGAYIYIITNQYDYNVIANYDNNTIIPLVSENGLIRKIPLEDIYCIDVPQYSYTLVHVVSINVKDDEEDVVDKIFTMGNSQTMYVSTNNIYITYDKYRSEYELRQEVYDEVLMPLIPDKIKNDIKNAHNFDISENNKKQVIDWILEGYLETLNQTIKDDIEDEIQRRLSSTIIHKISIADGQIEYMCNGTAPGDILNQFSMNEHNGFFRVATHLSGSWRSDYKQTTNVYVLDENLNIVGRINDIAPGEYLHSARFMSDRAYLVTFKKVDPFFTLDLSDPYNPKVLGKLKIPGFSDYLHPFDENHIIGIGLDTAEALDSQKEARNLDFAWYQGVKIAIFDVTDFENPKELARVIIGDRGTTTLVTSDHKAFLFDREKELMVLPINLHEISEKIKANNDGYTGNIYREFKLNGAYVYHISLEKGFELKGVITHNQSDQQQQYDEWSYYSYNPQISRALYIGNELYTISDGMLKINNIDDLSELTTISLI